MRNDRYTVVKAGDHEGPQETSTLADNIKCWTFQSSEESD